jgi:hypothetical protein
MYSYDSLEFAKKAIDAGFLDIANLYRFMNKIILIPTQK